MDFQWKDCWMQGRPLAESSLADLRETVIAGESVGTLQSRLASEQYLFARSVVPRNLIDAARTEVFGKLRTVGEIEKPAENGIFTGESFRSEVPQGLGEFWREVSQGDALRRASHGAEISQLMKTLLDEKVHAHDYLFLRPGVPGRSTHLHYDYPFFARDSRRIYTVWLALGDIPVQQGALVVAERSFEFHDLLENALAVDYDANDIPLVQRLEDPGTLVRDRGSRLLTANFNAGDVIVFSMYLLHGSLDNRDRQGKTRLSCDVRWQPAADPIDPRYVGKRPAGTTGAGYGELNGAKPLTQPWHQR